MKRIIASIFALFLILALGYAVGKYTPTVSKESHAEAHSYICPMHPQIIKNEPSTCPICGMDLVEAKSSTKASTGEPQAIHIPSAMAQSIGVQVSEVQLSTLSRKIRIQAVIEPDPQRIAMINARSMGWIESLPAGTVGEYVKEGQVLAWVQSPELEAAQQDFLQSLEVGNANLQDRASKRLRNLGLPQPWIDSLRVTKSVFPLLPIQASLSGIIVERNVVRGQNIMSGMDLFRLMDLSRIWVIGRAFPDDLRSLRVGLSAAISIAGEEESVRHGTVSFISPIVDPATKSADVRVSLANTGSARWRPGQFANMVMDVPLGKGISIANQSVIRTGERAVAFISTGKGHYAPRDLVLGARLGDSVEVFSGLLPGDSIVISSQFLLDAESQLQQSIGAAP